MRADRSDRPRVREWPITLVLLCVATGLAVVLSNHFRRGSVVISAALLLAALLRLVLPPRRAGLLAVRSRFFDVVVLATLGLAMFATAVVVPPPR
jgi:Protein of unknown function (DUF3017)